MNKEQNNPKKRQDNNSSKNSAGPARRTNRGAAIRAQKRASEDAHKIASQYLTAEGNGNKNQEKARPRANFIDDSPKLKFVGLGGMDSGGSKIHCLLNIKMT